MGDFRFVLFGFLLGLSTCTASCASGSESELKAVLSAQQSYFERIKAIQFNYQEQVTYSEGRRSIMRGRYVYSGERYFSELGSSATLPSARMPDVACRCGSNGKRTWQFRSDSRMLTVTSNQEYGKLSNIDNPLLMAFGWAEISVGESSMRLFSEAATWAPSRFTLAWIEHKARAGGERLTAEFVLSRNRSVPNRVVVEFAPESGFLPVAVDVYSTDSKTGRQYTSARISVLEITTVTVAGNPMAFPRKIETTLFGPDGQTRKRTTDEIDTGGDFKINQPVDESLFEFETNLPEGATVYDLDKREMVTTGPRSHARYGSARGAEGEREKSPGGYR